MHNYDMQCCMHTAVYIHCSENNRGVVQWVCVVDQI